MSNRPVNSGFHHFDRRFLESDEDFSVIGSGALGGKATGLAFIKAILADGVPRGTFPDVEVNIPRLAVLGTDVFVQFMERNQLYETALSDMPDDRIAHAFQHAELPPGVVGDLRALISRVHSPLAIRSSSLLEDAVAHPFAGTYATKMIPNNQPGVDERFRRLVEAVKFVYASTFSAEAKAYTAAIGHRVQDERMAVLIQEVVGLRYGDRFYPTLSGVLRTFNVYPTGPGRPEDGVVSLALGLGKTIVDGGVTWTFAPPFPRHTPALGSVHDLMHRTQTMFWAVNMGRPPAYNPIAETEYLVRETLSEAEVQGSLEHLVSTYDSASDRLRIGIGSAGPRVLTFAPILDAEVVPLTALVERVAACCREAVGGDVEIEFAMTLGGRSGRSARFGFLQLRAMGWTLDAVHVSEEELSGDRVLIGTESVLGNGRVAGIRDIVYVRPETFEARHTHAIADEVQRLNERLRVAGRPYLLIGFGRWGCADPWLGIPVTWAQISAARVIVEAMPPEMDVEPSQGSHFFHNISCFGVPYLTVRHAGPGAIDWSGLAALPAELELSFVRHVRCPSPLDVRVDGRAGRGVIRRL
jgi:hypothetical protein